MAVPPLRNNPTVECPRPRARHNGFAVLLRGNLVPSSRRCKAPVPYNPLETRQQQPLVRAATSFGAHGPCRAEGSASGSLGGVGTTPAEAGFVSHHHLRSPFAEPAHRKLAPSPRTMTRLRPAARKGQASRSPSFARTLAPTRLDKGRHKSTPRRDHHPSDSRRLHHTRTLSRPPLLPNGFAVLLRGNLVPVGCEPQGECPFYGSLETRQQQPLVRLPQCNDLISKIVYQGDTMVKPATTKLSTRGQVVIPEEIRNRLGLEPGAKFVVIGEGDVVVLKTLAPPKLEDLKPLLDKIQEAAEAAGLTPEDVEKAIEEVRASK